MEDKIVLIECGDQKEIFFTGPHFMSKPKPVKLDIFIYLTLNVNC